MAEEASRQPAPGDPSPLTTQQLWREVQHLKELIETKIEAIEKAIEVAHADAVRVPTEIQKQVSNLRELHNEKFASIEARFDERDKRFELEAINSKSAVDAAFDASKEAVGKSEIGFAKQIDQLAEMFRTSVKALEGKNDDVKDRLTRLEGKAEGTVTTAATHQASGRDTMQLIALIAAILIGVVSLGVSMLRGG